jgi:nitroreductase
MAKSDSIFSKVPDVTHKEAALQIDPKEFENLIQSRRSVRVYIDEPIPDDIISKCIDAALLAPNSSNLQPWEFYRVKSAENKKLVAKYCLNQPAAKTASELIICVARRDTWRKHAVQMLEFFKAQEGETPKSVISYYSSLVYLANTVGPFGILGYFKKIFIGIKRINGISPGGNSSIADMRVWAHKSTALACENLMLAFRAYGYDSCPMEGFDEKKIKKLLKLPRGAEPTMIISAGKRAENGVYAPRIRFPKEQFYFEI